MSVESYPEAESGHLFEELFIHYRKRRIVEKEMLDFFKSRGLEIKDRKQLEFFMYKAEKALGWMTAGVGPNWGLSRFRQFSRGSREAPRW